MRGKRGVRWGDREKHTLGTCCSRGEGGGSGGKTVGEGGVLRENEGYEGERNRRGGGVELGGGGGEVHS